MKFNTNQTFNIPHHKMLWCGFSITPSVTSLSVYPCMTRLAQRDEVAPVMCSAFRQRNLVVYFFDWDKHSLLVAQLTEGVCLNIAVTDAFPRTPVPFPCCRVTTVLLVTLILFLLVFLTEPSLCQLGTAGMMARMLCFPWHHCTS